MRLVCTMSTESLLLRAMALEGLAGTRYRLGDCAIPTLLPGDSHCPCMPLATTALASTVGHHASP